MAWVRLSDDFYDHPKFDKAGVLGIALFAAGLAWANRNLSDGFIPRKTALRLLDFEDVVEAVRNADRNAVTNVTDNDALTLTVARNAVQALVDAGLWHVEEGGYRIHDYLEYQGSREQIEASRQSNAARQKLWRERRKAEKEAQNKAPSDANRNGVTNGPVTGAPNPNPNPKEEEVLRTSSVSGEQPTDIFGETVDNQDAAPKRKRKRDDPFFAEFWSVYPKRTDKDGARRAWSRAIVDGTDARTIIAGAQLYARMWEGATPEELHFATKGSKWLADAMWDGSWPMRDMSRASNVHQLRPSNRLSGARGQIATAEQIASGEVEFRL